MTSVDGAFLRANARWLGAGILLTFASSFGQTFFIALFAEPIRAEIGLTHGAWGSLYASATLAAAVALGMFGKIADLRPTLLPGLLVMAGLALAAGVMSLATTAWLLALAVFGLRFAGQGLAGHVAATATARWFTATRGRALAISALGHPVGEAVLPTIAVAAMVAFGWRGAWWSFALILVLIMAPLLAWLLAKERTPRQRGSDGRDPDGLTPGLDGRHWSRAEVLRHPLFWAILPGFIASPLMGTAILFQSVPLMAAKGWPLDLYALAFPGYAAASVGAAYAAGILVDRHGAGRLLPLMLLPMSVGLMIGATPGPAWAVFPYLACFGLTTGMVFTVMNALWAELYGTRHLGAVRGLVSAISVFGTALGPSVTGVLLDLGVGLEAQLAVMAAIGLVLAASLALVARQLRRWRAALA